ncbi:hypothetical protein ACJX0J_026339 [Zea mays]
MTSGDDGDSSDTFHIIFSSLTELDWGFGKSTLPYGYKPNIEDYEKDFQIKDKSGGQQEDDHILDNAAASDNETDKDAMGPNAPDAGGPNTPAEADADETIRMQMSRFKGLLSTQKPLESLNET